MKKTLSQFIVTLMTVVLGFDPAAFAAAAPKSSRVADIEAGDPVLVQAPRGLNVRKSPNAARIGAIPDGNTVIALGSPKLHDTGRAGKQYWLPIKYQNESNEWVQGWIYMRYATASDSDERPANIIPSKESGTDGTQNALTQPRASDQDVAASVQSMRLSVNVTTRGRVRAGPSFSSPILDRLNNDTAVDIIGKPHRDWIPVRVVSTGQKGWMHTTILEAEGKLNPLELADHHPKSAFDAAKEIKDSNRGRETEAGAAGTCTTCRPKPQLEALPTGNSGYIKPVNAAIGSKFGNRFHPILKKYRQHNGVDFRVASGTSVKNIRGGTIVSVKSGCRVGDSRCGGGLGNNIVVDHGNGVVSVYAHLNSVNVRPGDRIAQGAVLGKSGSTGLASGPHLHLEIHENGRKVDPLKYLK
jgi:murein DD-endopeptidase MepM/ murein hydrolase activator NlpD